MPGSAMILRATSSDTALTASEVDPFRSTITSSGSAAISSVLSSPADRPNAKMLAHTTMPTPKMVISEPTLRARRLRRLYFSGTMNSQLACR